MVTLFLTIFMDDDFMTNNQDNGDCDSDDFM